MNKVSLLNTAGFPFETNTLDFMQNTYRELQVLTAFGGDNCIVSGCVVAGSNVTDGFVVIAGELLPFFGGLAQARVVIKEDKTPMDFENGSVHDVYFKRYATFGSSNPNVLFSDLKRVKNLVDLTREIQEKALAATLEALTIEVDKLKKQNAVFTAGGGMVMWNKAANLIPLGWREVVEWRGRLPFGVDINDPVFNAVGKTGGAKEKTLIASNTPEHWHYTVVNESENGNAFPGDTGRSLSDKKSMIVSWNKQNGGGREAYVMYGQPGNFPQQQPNVSPTSKAGSAAPEPINILNPFRTVYFIEYIGE